ncbi:tlde1 domain-containing protein [Paraburkholderia sp. CI3]|uniref:tlde1 domain-containing protein n=1 Tax=Paraburkholderia sp. CI3 TaxID=2991060 RepID=UPI003D257CDC
MIQGIRRGQFRLHPEGSRHLSQGCITVKDLAGFERLQRYIRRTRQRCQYQELTYELTGE